MNKYLSEQGLMSVLVQLGLIFLVSGLVYAIHRILHKSLEPRLKTTNRNWDDALVRALKGPFDALIVLFSVTLAVDFIRATLLPYSILSVADTVREIGVAIILVWFLLSFITQFKDNIMVVKPSGKTYDFTTVHALAKLAQLSAVIIGILMAMQALRIPISGIVVFGGGSALIVGIAAQDLLANFFGGVVVILDQPFKIGDWINLPDKNIEGTVEHIGWRQTLVRGFDKRPFYVPNSLFTKLPIQNPSRMTNRRIKQIVGVRYCDVKVLADITRDIKTMLKEHKEIDPNMALFVTLDNFGDSSLDILIYTFTKTTAWIPFQEIQQEILLLIAGIVEKHGAEIAFPTRTLDVPDGFLSSGQSGVT